MTFQRVTSSSRNGKDPPEPPDVMREWLDDMMREREAVIMRLRQIDEVLVRHGRIRSETIGKRMR